MTDYELIKLLLDTADSLRLIKQEVQRRQRVGHAALQGRGEVQTVRSFADTLAGAMAEVAARLAYTQPPPPPQSP